MYEIDTDRLRLRTLTFADAEQYYRQIYADPDVMLYLPGGKPRPFERMSVILTRIRDHWEQFGFGLWGVENKASGELIGHCGLQHLADTPEIEVAYALGKLSWGQGIASEAARASLRYGFEQMGLDRIVAIAVPENGASRRVMVKLGMVYEKDIEFNDFRVAYYAISREAFDPGTGRYALKEVTGEPTQPS